jgi:hypothetical protein
MLLDRVWINQLFTGVNKLNFKFKKHREHVLKSSIRIEFLNVYLKFYFK